MKYMTTASIYLHGVTHAEGAIIDLEDQDTITELQAQGLIRKPTRTVEVEIEDEKPKASAPIKVEEKKTDEPVQKSLSKMNRTELDEVATGLGMDNLTQYETNKALIAAIEAKKTVAQGE